MSQIQITTEEQRQAERAAVETYAQHIEAAQAKTAQDREIETLTAQLDTLTAELATMHKNPSAYDRATLKAKQEQHEALYRQLAQLGAAVEIGRQHKPKIGFTLIGGEIHKNVW